jgi:hypothetical protein
MVAAWITADELVNPLSRYADDAVDAASFVLFHLSGRKYGGVRTTTETYCQVGLDQIGMSTYYGPNRPPLPGPSGYSIMFPELMHGVVTNRIGMGCSSCGCTHLLRLRGAPVLDVSAVSVGARALDPSTYAVYDHSYIAAPSRCWNTCDDVTVTYRYGAPPPALGRIAAKALADQYVLAMEDSDECTLPQRVTQISRQGMSWTLLDPQDFLDKGRTGIYQVDLFLSTVNPDGARMRARVFSPDIPRARTVRGDRAPTPFAFAAPAMAAPRATVSSTSQVITDLGRPLRWVVPGVFTVESPPTLVVRPSGEEVPPDALSWRFGSFTLDLTSDQVERLLPPGSVLVVSSTAGDGNTTGEASYLVERRTP